jgi:hypothetical protein
MVTKLLCIGVFSSLMSLNLNPKAVLRSHEAAPQQKGMLMTSSAPPRPGHIAELQELEAARKAGTLAAYDLFLARHPTSRYAPDARKERAVLAGK